MPDQLSNGFGQPSLGRSAQDRHASLTQRTVGIGRRYSQTRLTQDAYIFPGITDPQGERRLPVDVQPPCQVAQARLLTGHSGYEVRLEETGHDPRCMPDVRSDKRLIDSRLR